MKKINIEIKKNEYGRYSCFIRNDREKLGIKGYGENKQDLFSRLIYFIDENIENLEPS